MGLELNCYTAANGS